MTTVSITLGGLLHSQNIAVECHSTCNGCHGTCSNYQEITVSNTDLLLLIRRWPASEIWNAFRHRLHRVSSFQSLSLVHVGLWCLRDELLTCHARGTSLSNWATDAVSLCCSLWIMLLSLHVGPKIWANTSFATNSLKICANKAVFDRLSVTHLVGPPLLDISSRMRELFSSLNCLNETFPGCRRFKRTFKRKRLTVMTDKDV